MDRSTDHSDLTSIRELEYIAKIYMTHGDLDKAAEVMALAETITRRANVSQNDADNIEWLELYRPDEENRA